MKPKYTQQELADAAVYIGRLTHLFVADDDGYTLIACPERLVIEAPLVDRVNDFGCAACGMYIGKCA